MKDLNQRRSEYEMSCQPNEVLLLNFDKFDSDEIWVWSIFFKSQVANMAATVEATVIKCRNL